MSKKSVTIRYGDGEVFAVIPRVKGAVAYDVYMGPAGTRVLDAYIPPETEPVRIGRFDRDGNMIEAAP